MSKVKTITLNDGVKIPILAFGTGTAQAWTDTSSVVGMALQKGYRHFDCAWHYKNAVYTGKALRDSGIPREDIFVTCKIGSFEDDPREFDARKFMDVMLKDFGVGHVDLLLLHADILVGSVTHAWRQMESIKKGGLTRSIGVSNFSARSLEEILRMCEIAVYGGLVSLVRHRGGSVDEVVRRICQERGLGETEGQVLLRWAQQVSGGVVITTTNKPERMEEQLGPFLADRTDPPLSQEHLDQITSAGASAPFRFWGTNWPYFMKGEGGISACPEDATHRRKPDINGGRGW